MRINKINIIITVMMLATVTSYAFACSIIGMIGRNGNTLTGYDINNGNRTAYTNILGQFRTDFSANPDGFGIAYYTNETGNKTGDGKIWTTSSLNVFTISNRYASCKSAGSTEGQAQYNQAVNEMRLLNTKIVVGHLRQQTTGATGVPAPAPMVYMSSDNLHYLTFNHNGTISQDYYLPNQYVTENWYNQVQNYLTLNPDNEHLVLLSGNDSQVYFAYLLMHIKQNNWDILRGLSSALNNVGSQHGTSLNFILSDGNDLYGYRYEFAYLPNSSNFRTLQYIVFDNVIGRVNSTLSLKYNFGLIERNLTYSDLTGTGIQESDFNLNLKNMPQDQLVYIPNKGKIVVIDQFSTTSTKKMLKNTNSATSGRTVFNWESFPIMRGTSDDACRTFRQYGTYNGFTYSGNGFDQANYGINSDLLYASRDDDGNWVYSENQSWTVEPKKGYKINSNSAETAVIAGTLCNNTTGFGSMSVGPIYWIGYWLMNSQSLREALGDNFSKVRKVWAENWYYDNLENEAKTDIYPANSPDRPMEFGKMYAIQLSQFTTPITDFKWTNSRKPATANLNMQSSFFNYNQTASYEAIDILNITKNTLPYTEIAVYDGETCIGATTVDQYPVQILAYTEGREGHTLTFRALNENGVVSEINPVIDVFDGKSGKFKPQALVAGEIDYARVQIAEQSQAETQINQSSISEHNCYPNPFNPTTTIRFSMNQPGSVKVEIFNVKGQKVKQLFSGSLTAGKHYLTWTGKDEQNQTVGSGIYFYKIQSQNNTVTKKMILMK